MAEFLLLAVNAKYIHTCLAVYDLAAYARVRGQEVVIRETTINEKQEKILDGIVKEAPAGVFFACYIWNISRIRDMLPKLHERIPDTALYLGGPEVSYDEGVLLADFPYLGGILIGEGEASFHALLQRWSSREAMGKVIRAPALLPMDEIPFPYSDEMLAHAGERGKILYYETSRGCPFSCSYCLSSAQEGVRLRSLPLVKEELQRFLDAKVPQVKFVDRTFNCNHAHALGIWRYLIAHDNGVTNFHFEIGADLLTEEELALLRKMRRGLVQLEIGVQTTNEKTLSAVSRAASFARLRHAVGEIRDGGNILMHLDLIAGLPYEDYQSFANSFNDVFAMEPDQLQLGFLKVLKGTSMREEAPWYGIHFQDTAPYEVIRTPWLSSEEIGKLTRIARIVDIYYNSAQFTQSLPYLIEKAGNAFRFFEALSLYYEKHGIASVCDARIVRYEALRDFSLGEDFPSVDGVPGEPLIEKLSVDLYLREKLKHRPDWVHDLTDKMTFDYGRRDSFTGNAEVTKR